jgi:hypothetical protein
VTVQGSKHGGAALERGRQRHLPSRGRAGPCRWAGGAPPPWLPGALALVAPPDGRPRRARFPELSLSLSFGTITSAATATPTPRRSHGVLHLPHRRRHGRAPRPPRPPKGVRGWARLGRAGGVAPEPVPAGLGARRAQHWGVLLPSRANPDDGFYIVQFQVCIYHPLPLVRLAEMNMQAGLG